MTRATSSGHLGGIGLMLEVSRLCPRCGKRVSDAPAAVDLHLNGNGCRPVVYAALPEPDAIMAEDPPVPAGRQIHDFEAPDLRGRRRAPFSSVEPNLMVGDADRPLAIPWLRPPDLGEVL